jgi:hypothetical protein
MPRLCGVVPDKIFQLGCSAAVLGTPRASCEAASSQYL